MYENFELPKYRIVLYILILAAVIGIAVASNIWFYGHFVTKKGHVCVPKYSDEWWTLRFWPESECGIPIEEWPAVAFWAYSEYWDNLDRADLPQKWNSQHSELFVIHGTDDLYESTKRIYQAYKDEVVDKPASIILKGGDDFKMSGNVFITEEQ